MECKEMGTDAACLAELETVEKGTGEGATAGEVTTEFAMERADAEARLDVGETGELEDESEHESDADGE